MRITAETRFAIIPEWVLFAPISPTAVRLYGVLARHADKEDHFSIVGRGKLAEQARVAVHTVDRALAELAGIGAVAVEHRVDPNNPLHLLPNRYLLAVAPPKPAAQGSPKRDTTPTHRTSPTRGGSPKNVTGSERVLGSKGSSLNPKSSQPGEAVAPRPRQPDPIFEALCEIGGHGWADLNSVERGRLNKARRLAAESKASPEAIREATARWPDVMGDATLTALGVMSNFQRLLTGPARQPRRAAELPLDRVAREAMEEMNARASESPGIDAPRALPR
jgi:hypothetical protein